MDPERPARLTDDPGYGGLIQQPRPGKGRLQQLQLVPGDGDALLDVSGDPAHLADRVLVLLTFWWRAHPAEPASASPRETVMPNSGATWCRCRRVVS